MGLLFLVVVERFLFFWFQPCGPCHVRFDRLTKSAAHNVVQIVLESCKISAFLPLQLFFLVMAFAGCFFWGGKGVCKKTIFQHFI